MKNDVSYDYKPKPIMALLAAILFLGFAYGSALAAMTNERGIRIIGITLDSDVANVIFWVFSVFCIFLSLKLILVMINGARGSKVVTLTSEAIIAPKSVASGKYVTVKYSEISEMKLQKTGGKLFLHVKHLKGKLTIPSAVFTDIESFQDLVKRLSMASNAVS